MNDVGNRVRQRRLELGMTQDELARKVGYATRGSINKIETCRDMPIKRLKPIADALDISVGDLMGWEDEPIQDTDMLADWMLNIDKYNLLITIDKLTDKNREQIANIASALLMSQGGKDDQA